MQKQVLILFAFTFFCLSKAQKENLSSFYDSALNYQLPSKYFIYGEIEVHGNENFFYPDYYEIKSGLGYKLTKNNSALIGFGLINNYDNSVFNKQELRVWIQDVININAGIFKFENRFQLEQSWIYEPIKYLNSTRNRLRYRLNISAPLHSKKVEKGTISTNIYDEVFFSTPQKPTFSRNRLYGGLSYQINKEISASSGYLWERNFSLIKNNNFHYLYFALNFNIAESDKKEINSQPVISD